LTELNYFGSRVGGSSIKQLARHNADFGIRSAETMRKDPINYFQESERYRPKTVRTLLIAEAPPPSRTKYFYVPRPMQDKVPVEKDTSLPATIFYHYFKKRPKTVGSMSTFSQGDVVEN